MAVCTCVGIVHETTHDSLGHPLRWANAGKLAENRTFNLTIPQTASWLATFGPLFEQGLAAIGETGSVKEALPDDQSCDDDQTEFLDDTTEKNPEWDAGRSRPQCVNYEGYVILVDRARKFFIGVSDADAVHIGLGIRKTSTPFFEPIFKNLEFNANAALVVDIHEAYLGLGLPGEPPAFEISCSNGKGEIRLDLTAKIVNPLNKPRHRHRRVLSPRAFDRQRRQGEGVGAHAPTSEAISVSQLQNYLRDENNTMFDMIEASLTIGGGLSLTNIQIKLAGLPIDGWLEVTQEDVVVAFIPERPYYEITAGNMTVRSSLDDFNLKCFGIKDILNLIEIAIGIFEGSEDEPGGILSGVSDTTLPFMDLTIGEVLSFIGDAIDLLQALLDDPAGSLDKINQAINEAIASALGVDLVTIEFGIDSQLKDDFAGIDGQVLTLQIAAGADFSAKYGFDIDLEDIMGDLGSDLKGIVDVGLSGGISFDASASAVIKMGIALPGTNCDAKTKKAAADQNATANDIPVDGGCNPDPPTGQGRSRRFVETAPWVHAARPTRHIPCKCVGDNKMGWTADPTHSEPHTRERRATSVSHCRCPERKEYQAARAAGNVCAEAPEFVELSDECRIVCSHHTSYYNSELCMGKTGRASSASACCDHHAHTDETTTVVPHNDTTIVSTKRPAFWSRWNRATPCGCPELLDYRWALSEGKMCMDSEAFLMLSEECRHACSMHDAYYSQITCQGHFGIKSSSSACCHPYTVVEEVSHYHHTPCVCSSQNAVQHGMYDVDARAIDFRHVSRRSIVQRAANPCEKKVDPFIKLVVYDTTAITLQLQATANGELKATVGPLEIEFEAVLDLGKTILLMDEPATFRIGVNATMISTDSSSIGNFFKEVFKSTEWGLTAAAMLNIKSVGPMRDIVDNMLDMEINIPNIWEFLTADNKTQAVDFVKKPKFDLQQILLRLLDPRMLIRAFDKGLKFLSRLLVGGSSVAKKIPIKWLKAKLVAVMSGSGAFIESFRKKAVKILNDLLTKIEDEGLGPVVAHALTSLFHKDVKLIQLCTDNFMCAREPAQYAHCLKDSGTNQYWLNDTNPYDSAQPACLAKVNCNKNCNVTGLYAGIFAGIEWTIPLGMVKRFNLPDVDFGFGPLPFTLQFQSSFMLNWGLWLTFGFSTEDGFYLKKRGGGQPDFTIDASLDARNLEATGNLFFFDLIVTDFRSEWQSKAPERPEWPDIMKTCRPDCKGGLLDEKNKESTTAITKQINAVTKALDGALPSCEAVEDLFADGGCFAACDQGMNNEYGYNPDDAVSKTCARADSEVTCESKARNERFDCDWSRGDGTCTSGGDGSFKDMVMKKTVCGKYKVFRETVPGQVDLTGDPNGIGINDITEKFAYDPMILIAMSAYLLPNAEDNTTITLKTLKSRKGSLVAVSAVARLQVALKITAEVKGGLPDFSFVLYGKVMYSKSFGLGAKNSKGSAKETGVGTPAAPTKNAKSGAKGGTFTYDFHLLYPNMELGPFLKNSILKPLKEISNKLAPVVDPLRDLVKPQKILTMFQGKPTSILDFIVEM